MCIVLAYVRHRDDPTKEISTYVLLDNDCTGCFGSREVLDVLAPDRLRPANVTIETINGRVQQMTKATDGLIVRCAEKHAAIYNSIDVQLPTTYCTDALPFGKDEMATVDKLSRWEYLKEVVKTLPEYNENIPFGLMIGGDCVKALEPHQVITSKEDGPFAYRTLLGWCVVGPVDCKSNGGTVQCHFTNMRVDVQDVVTGNQTDHHFSMKPTVKDNAISDALNAMYNIEFHEENSEAKGLSNEDEKFLRILRESVKRSGGHYEVALPFRDIGVEFPNNRSQAMQRLFSVKRKMLRNPQYQQEYTQFVENLLTKGYARKQSSNKATPGKVWYLPHHGVSHSVKKSIRVVFDCSARFQQRCLNDELLQGPDLVNQLVGVLIRFRKEPIAFSADIESMFYQIRVPEEQRSFLRFLWWPGGDLTKPIKEYEMCVHVFGAISSPSCANFVLKQTAIDNGEEFGEDAKLAILRDFYVDDVLKSTNNEETAISLLSRVQSSCKKGGFNLTKVMSNCMAVIDSVSQEKRAPSLQHLTIGKLLPIERALGVTWYIEKDELGFRISIVDTPLTRRNILATISSIYDPLGIVSPFLLRGRKILQEIAADCYSWDDVIKPQQRAAWTTWRDELPLLMELTVKRCYKPSDFGNVIDVSLHHFCDACFVGYGNCSYIRQVNEAKKIHVALVKGKSRVSPLKPTTIPRLELTSAVLSTTVGATEASEIHFPNIKQTYWSDSQICLGYIRNETKRFRLFVANRDSKFNATQTSLNGDISQQQRTLLTMLLVEYLSQM